MYCLNFLTCELPKKYNLITFSIFLYSGTVIGGKMITDVKFYYPIGSSVKYECDSILHLNGASRLECLENGVWSSAVPLCGKSTEDNE